MLGSRCPLKLAVRHLPFADRSRCWRSVLGGFLRPHQIGSKGLWLDEAFSVWMGGQPVGEMLGWVVSIDQHPPLYY